ncbi:hypothetical protein ACFL3S_08705 [Gemmatimonadota bacterium]
MIPSRRLTSLVLTMLAVGCGGDPPPIHDGLTLIFDAPASGECRLAFSSTGRDFRISPSGPSECPLRPDGLGDEWIVDDSGQHNGRPVWWGELTGEYGPLWLPAGMREVGTHRYGLEVRITEVADWEGRRVAIMLQPLGPLEVKTYYDMDSGFMAGVDKRFGGGWNRILVLKSTQR